MRPLRASFLPFHRPWIDETEVEEVVDTLRSGWLTMGPKTLKFEERFADYIGAKHAVAVSSATAGLHLALDALGLQPDDEIITSTYTFTSTAAVALHLRARPVLVDVLPGQLGLDPEAVERAITPRTRAIVPVHIAGRAVRHGSPPEDRRTPRAVDRRGRRPRAARAVSRPPGRHDRRPDGLQLLRGQEHHDR